MSKDKMPYKFNETESNDVTGGVDPVEIEPIETRFFSYLYCMMYAHPDATPEYVDGVFQSAEEIVNQDQILGIKQMVIDQYPTMTDVKKLVIRNFNFLGMVGEK